MLSLLGIDSLDGRMIELLCAASVLRIENLQTTANKLLKLHETQGRCMERWMAQLEEKCPDEYIEPLSFFCPNKSIVNSLEVEFVSQYVDFLFILLYSFTYMTPHRAIIQSLLVYVTKIITYDTLKLDFTTLMGFSNILNSPAVSAISLRGVCNYLLTKKPANQTDIMVGVAIGVIVWHIEVDSTLNSLRQILEMAPLNMNMTTDISEICKSYLN